MIKFVRDLFKEVNLKPKNFRAFTVGAILFPIFLVTMLAETTGVFSTFDPVVTRFLQARIPRFLDMPLSVFSLLGSFEIMGTLTVVLGLIIFRRKKLIYYPLVFFGVILLFEFIGKLLLYHPNPPPFFFRYTLPFSFPTSYIQTKYSFPSGHVSRTLFVAITTAFFGLKFLPPKWSRPATLFWVLFSLTMVISRVYLGEHWASDTIGGVLLGGAMGFFALTYF